MGELKRAGEKGRITPPVWRRAAGGELCYRDVRAIGMDILGIRMDDIVGAMNYHVIIETRAIRENDKTAG
jgi:hypothetical protein